MEEKYDTGAFIPYMFSPGNLSKEGKNYFYFYRPGHEKFLLKLQSHPRIRLVFYSSMLEKNITPIVDGMLGPSLSSIRDNLKIFDQRFHRRMQNHPLY
jgi:hypothetical protein